jgi:hypothetical protein
VAAITKNRNFFKWPKLLWIKDGADGHNFERGPPKDHFSSLFEIDSVVSEEKIF